MKELYGATSKPLGMGWLPDIPDVRDYSPEHEAIKPTLAKLGLSQTTTATLPNAVDLRNVFNQIPVEDQRSLGSCTAQAAASVIEYYQQKAFGTYLDASRLFLYKATRNLLGWTGDTGAFNRTTMGAMALFGAPPEKYWPYDIDEFDNEPTAFCYGFGENYEAIRYYRLDPPTIDRATILQNIKAHLAAALPSMFGFTVYDSIRDAESTGKIPFPCPKEDAAGGHAIVAVGYDNTVKISNPRCGRETTGALLIRNSWGSDWGDEGYAWMPYEYVTSGLARDWWTLIRAKFVDTGVFGLH